MLLLLSFPLFGDHFFQKEANRIPVRAAVPLLADALWLSAGESF
jgi:hypothetical protein